MKKSYIVVCISVFGLTAPLFADHPCKQITASCQAAGFYKGGHKKGPNKGLFKDCLNPILAGQSVAGVTVNPAVVSACKAKKAEKGKS